MSESHTVSPLLDGFALGNAMSHHDGVSCIPAVKEHSGDKYIVKVISIPASQVQLDALLLAGAYKDAASAMDYFKELSEGVVHEAECLKKLSKLEGFLPFERWQVVPMEKSKLGYQVYLVGSYKRSLEKYMRRNNMTHLAAVNLGLDMCAALAVARQAGWIYVDLKPSNIFISEDKEYRIGDLGFMALDSLKYSALPSKYRSPYNAPELSDPLATPNDTIDTYAVGIILYQIFNDGVLPQVEHPGEDVLPAPANADYEIAEIILKACTPDPKDRWHDPVEMGQALVAYMQRNSVNDTPILPPQVSVPSAPAVPIQPVLDETLPSVADAEPERPDNLSDEMNAILDQADDLISHQMPELIPDKEEEPQEVSEEDSSEEAAKEVHIPEPVIENEDVESLTDPTKQQRLRAFGIAIMVLFLLAAGSAGFWFYNNIYMQTIDQLQVDGAGSEMTVLVDTQVDEALLTVICTDTYGNTKTLPLENGKARFTGLLPDMIYKISLEIDGFHGLRGSTTHEFTTPSQTSIVSFSAVTGPEDGSVILNFTIEGPDSDAWQITYWAEDEEEQSTVFTGHTTTVNGLTVGKEYSFRLGTTVEQTLIGEDTIAFTASKIVYAENLEIIAVAGGTMTVNWTYPEDAAVESWNVRCYNSKGYEKLVTTSELTASFDGIDTTVAHTIEVTAAGMTQPTRTTMTANPLNITSIQVDADQPEKLVVTWEFEGIAPIGGWILMYTVDGSDREEVVQCDSNSGVIEVRVPGADYDLSIQAADGTSVYENSLTYRTPDAAVYENKAYGIYAKHTSEMMDVRLLPTPYNKNWSYKTIDRNTFTSTFQPGEGISVLMYMMVDFYVPRDNTSVLYVIRDSEGKVISDLTVKENHIWHDLWWNTNYHYCELNVPAIPTTAGDYNLTIYFNGMTITSKDFTITE